MKIVITGTGGQGVKLLGSMLAKILTLKGYEVAVAFDFDAAIRGGDSIANLVYSEEKIDNPTIDEADLLVELSKVKEKIPAKKTIDKIEGEPENIHALGIILKELKIDVDEEILRKVIANEEYLKVVQEEIRIS